ncbi:competence protein CoiA [Gracilimonas sp. BCB1]|uniref:competence protein CoiA n=1 Tax=Gracilimonas sp. BCB1 TaxID=3152362 RepID=UPI0032D93720
MKYALVNNKTEATEGARGICPSCGSKMIAKCGEKKAHHWAHLKSNSCDNWWENETAWHRNWKSHFPVEWQEVVHTSGNGEKHIADVKTDYGWVLEFQHSYIKPKERRARDTFYSKLIWIIDGLSRPTDIIQFNKALKKHAIKISQQPHILILYPKYCTLNCRLFEEWGTSNSLVYFDFHKVGSKTESDLWLLLPTNTYPESIYLMKTSRDRFIKYVIDGRIDRWYKRYILRMNHPESLLDWLKSL